jgi:uncharacterized Zn-binding protein involved in type VI secretion
MSLPVAQLHDRITNWRHSSLNASGYSLPGSFGSAIAGSLGGLGGVVSAASGLLGSVAPIASSALGAAGSLLGSGSSNKDKPITGLGIIISCQAANFLVNGRPVATVGDIGVSTGQVFLVTGSHSFFVNGKPLHRVLDANSSGGITLGPGAANFLVGN